MIRNPEILKNRFICGRILSQFLQTNGFPLLAIEENGKYSFRNTDILKEALKKIPWTIKVLDRIL